MIARSACKVLIDSESIYIVITHMLSVTNFSNGHSFLYQSTCGPSLSYFILSHTRYPPLHHLIHHHPHPNPQPPLCHLLVTWLPTLKRQDRLGPNLSTCTNLIHPLLSITWTVSWRSISPKFFFRPPLVLKIERYIRNCSLFLHFLGLFLSFSQWPPGIEEIT